MSLRARLDRLFDDGKWYAVGAAKTLACGYGRIDGRMVCAASLEPDGGSDAGADATLLTRLLELALRMRAPLVWLQGAALPLAHAEALVRGQAQLAGVVPIVAARLAGGGIVAQLADFLITLEGDGDLMAGDESECLGAIKEYLSFLPANCDEQPPLAVKTDPVTRRDERLDVATSPEEPLDVLQVLDALVDHRRLFALGAHTAPAVVTGLARIGGRALGIVANHAPHADSAADEAAHKAARFIAHCDRFHLPLLFLLDLPRFPLNAVLLARMAAAKVPKLSLVARAGSEESLVAGRAWAPDLVIAWQGADSAISADQVIDPRDTRQILAAVLELSANRR